MISASVWRSRDASVASAKIEGSEQPGVNTHVRLAANMANASIACEVAPGRFTGPVADLAAQLATALGLEVKILPFASDGAILAEAGALDIAVLAVDAARTQVRYAYEVARVSATLAGREDDMG